MNEQQASDSVLLVRPARFGFHAAAAKTNLFAKPVAGPETAKRALEEFNALAERLARAGVNVLILKDAPEPAKPDAIFPNNWASFHQDGTVVVYPMATTARRLERNVADLTTLLEGGGFEVRRVIDLTAHEHEGRFLEGTGSLVLDRPAGEAYATIGPRTDPAAVANFDEQLGYSTFMFEASDARGRLIYHTNVLLTLGTQFAVLCTEAVAVRHRAALISRIEASGRALIAVDFDQMARFACNLIELNSRDRTPLIALSQSALRSFTPDQLRFLESFGELVDVTIPTIETVGGGSVRCMIADIHLPRS